MSTIGIIGAGKVGTAVARLALAAGDEVLIAGSPNAQFLEQILAMTAPGARVASLDELADAAELTVLAVPFGKIDTVDLERFNGAVVVDATNYWEPVDGTPAILDGAGILSTSEVVQRRHPGLRLVKSLNHLGYHDMDTDAAPVGASGRRAVAVAGDDAEAGGLVGAFLDRIGFDPVHIGSLADGAILQPGEELFGRFVQRAELLAVAAEQGELAA
ncbi:MAG: NAD(P)-binding domain-containing protein [Microterricola sp.]